MRLGVKEGAGSASECEWVSAQGGGSTSLSKRFATNSLCGSVFRVGSGFGIGCILLLGVIVELADDTFDCSPSSVRLAASIQDGSKIGDFFLATSLGIQGVK